MHTSGKSEPCVAGRSLHQSTRVRASPDPIPTGRWLDPGDAAKRAAVLVGQHRAGREGVRRGPRCEVAQSVAKIPTTSKCCSLSTTSPVSTASTCAPPTWSSRRSHSVRYRWASIHHNAVWPKQDAALWRMRRSCTL